MHTSIPGQGEEDDRQRKRQPFSERRTSLFEDAISSVRTRLNGNIHSLAERLEKLAAGGGGQSELCRIPEDGRPGGQLRPRSLRGDRLEPLLQPATGAEDSPEASDLYTLPPGGRHPRKQAGGCLPRLRFGQQRIPGQVGDRRHH